MHDVALEQREPAQLTRRECAACAREVARLEARVEELDQLAHRDPLYRLPNPAACCAELETRDRQAERHGTPAAMLFVDSTASRCSTTAIGHIAGDAALVQVAAAAQGPVRASDVAARSGGDEFCAAARPSRRRIARSTPPSGSSTLHRRLRIPLDTAMPMPLERRDRRRH